MVLYVCVGEWAWVGLGWAGVAWAGGLDVKNLVVQGARQRGKSVEATVANPLGMLSSAALMLKHIGCVIGWVECLAQCMGRV